MILPLTRDIFTPRSLPAVSLLFIVVAICASIAIRVAEPAHAGVTQEAHSRVVEFQRQHPYLQLPTVIDPVLHQQLTVEDFEAAGESLPHDRSDIRDPVVRSEQEQLDDLVRALSLSHGTSPLQRFGFVPAKTRVLGLATHPFLHTHWLALIVNAWFLWLCGCNLERRWRPWIFAPTLFGAAVVGAFAYKAFGSSPTTPLLGAAPAVSGLVAGVAVALGTERVRLGTMLQRPYVFGLPAWTVALFWVAAQVTLALALDITTSPWALAGGGVLGAVCAAGLRFSGAERTLDPEQNRTVSVQQDRRVSRASELVAEGRPIEALRLLREVADEQPSNIDVQLEMLRAAKAAGDPQKEILAYGRLIDLYMRSGAINTAMELFVEVKRLHREHELDPADRIRVADRLANRGRLHEAAEIYATVYDLGVRDLDAIRALLGHARVSVKMGRTDEARALLERAKESPYSTVEVDERIDSELAKLQ